MAEPIQSVSTGLQSQKNTSIFILLQQVMSSGLNVPIAREGKRVHTDYIMCR
jgi:hypothetical protein